MSVIAKMYHFYISAFFRSYVFIHIRFSLINKNNIVKRKMTLLRGSQTFQNVACLFTTINESFKTNCVDYPIDDLVECS